MQYLKGGIRLNLTVAIDFTGSNKDPYDSSSLHFINPSAPNHYQQALFSVS